jgi:UDP-N-acetylglucosamine--N-acetylmuramyl-(pentapeptide) pyrophosphoryl-undecaprenol N-acetylglucosamine transferase
MAKRIILAVGGSGGHLFPAESLFTDLDRYGEALFAGYGLSKNPFFNKKYPYCDVAASPSLFRADAIGRGVVEAMQLIHRFKPDLMVGFGSYHTLPLMIGAVIKRVPLVLFVADSVPGRVLRCAAPFAKEVASVFPIKSRTTTLVQMPLRQMMRKKPDRDLALNYFGLNNEAPILLVTGGSQGSRFINQTFTSLYESRLEFDPQIIHITGSQEDYEFCLRGREALSSIRRTKIIIKPFEEKMELAWSLADLALTRAGAVSLFEQYLFEVPGIAIPFPEAMDNHQEANARYFEDKGVCTVCRQKDTCSETLARSLQSLFLTRKERMNKIRASRSQDRAKLLIEVVENYL